MIKRLHGQEFIMHEFEGDDFQTKIWRSEGKLMAEDPKAGIRQISVMDYKDGQYIMDGQIMRGRHELNPESIKARILEQLLRDGVPFDKANQISVIMALKIKEGKKTFSGFV